MVKGVNVGGSALPEPTGQGLTAGTVIAAVHTGTAHRDAESATLLTECLRRLFDELGSQLERLDVPPQCHNGRGVSPAEITSVLAQNLDAIRDGRFPFDPGAEEKFDDWRRGSGRHRPWNDLNAAHWSVTGRWAIRAIPNASPQQLFALGRLLGVAEGNLSFPDRESAARGFKTKKGKGENVTELEAWARESFAKRMNNRKGQRAAALGVWKESYYEQKRKAGDTPENLRKRLTYWWSNRKREN